MKKIALILVVITVTIACTNVLAAEGTVGVSPWGADDEIGRLNLMTVESQAAILSRLSAGKTYDLAAADE